METPCSIDLPELKTVLQDPSTDLHDVGEHIEVFGTVTDTNKAQISREPASCCLPASVGQIGHVVQLSTPKTIHLMLRATYHHEALRELLCLSIGNTYDLSMESNAAALLRLAMGRHYSHCLARCPDKRYNSGKPSLRTFQMRDIH